MLKSYRTKQGDVLDAVCLEHYGVENMVNAVILFNPRLCEHLDNLPQGMLINFPERIEKQVAPTTLRVWS